MIPKLPHGFSHPVKIGSGGFGDVYRVRQNALSRIVALKFIHNTTAINRSALTKEASMQASLHIPGIPQIYDVKEFSKQICIIMQWINGCDMRALLKQRISYDDRIAVATEIIKVCALLHDKGYAHRDIKPENILISSDGVFLIDFGLTRNNLYDNIDTGAKQLNGTPAYIAPEIWQGANSADQRCADVYALGKVVQELLDSSALPACVHKALATDPDERYGTACDLYDEWIRAVSVQSKRWQEVAELTANDILSTHIATGSQVLLQHGRADEAYELLVESLQLNPDNPNAIQLLELFPVQSQNTHKRRGARCIIVSILTVCLLASISIYPVAKTTLKNQDTTESTNLETKSIFIASEILGTTEIKDLPFKDARSDLKSISGTLRISGHPANGRFFMDGQEMGIDTGTIAISIPNLNHTCIWRNDDQGVTWKEMITVLPFAEKRIWIKER